ncbi:ATP-binding cassette domain-containing protein [Paenibacillus doosanensis]|uniref:ABC transporter ATP-binding protein n=1 Tax=Paenibacillus doosanensis TaxID=1229154 RepID=UPI00217F9671|nr:ATP-binding cassette domain-containing protein [Paenibacillus doosanensis]MCS7458898.1 ATP-binding cassette domain-containing protein [Paenibacillus doosanensis]
MPVSTSVTGLRLKFAGSPSLLFDDISFSVNTGQKVLLLGPSGCGKSTLLQVLTGLIPDVIEIPVKFDEIVIPPSWGYVFQDPDTQFCMPFVDEEMAFVLENLGVPREEMTARIEQGLRQVGLNLPKLHLDIQSMSQGMKQRLAIASVLALEPEVLFFDEPTALLDPEGTKQVWDTIKQIGKDKTVLIVEHKIDEVIDFVDRVVLFTHDGAILADGSPETVFDRHKERLQQFGIWYPGVWSDYAAGAAYRALRDADGAGPAAGREYGNPLLQLKQFTAFRGREPKMHVDEAQAGPGEWIAVVGENGAGKSTLLQAMMQLIPASGEAYRLAGREVRGFKDVADCAAYVFQNPEMQFVTHSVLDEAAFGFRRDGVLGAEKQALALLEEFGLEEQRSQHPYQLSLGQKRRLSVATAMVKEQRLVLLDEPTFGQDAANTFAILEKLEAWRRQGTTIIMVTHDLDIVRYFATRVWEIERGRLAKDLQPRQYLRAAEEASSSDVAETPPSGALPVEA